MSTLWVALPPWFTNIIGIGGLFLTVLGKKANAAYRDDWLPVCRYNNKYVLFATSVFCQSFREVSVVHTLVMQPVVRPFLTHPRNPRKLPILLVPSSMFVFRLAYMPAVEQVWSEDDKTAIAKLVVGKPCRFEITYDNTENGMFLGRMWIPLRKGVPALLSEELVRVRLAELNFGGQ